MSTILKALRRLERERQPDPSRPLQQDVVAYRPGEPQDPRRRPAYVAAGAAIALSLGLGGLWLSSDGGGRGSEPRLEAGEPAGARAEGAERSDPPAPVPRPAPPAVVVAPPRLEEAPAPPSPASSTPSLAEDAGSDAASAPTEDLPYRLPDPTPLAAYQEPAPREEVAEVSPAPARLAPVRTLAPEPAVLPTLAATVESTTWHPDASRRVARVSAPGREAVSLREGDALGELVILRIEPAGVVFLYRGSEIRQGVGRRASPAD